MNKRIFASLLLTVFALGVSGCTEKESSSFKAEEKETKSAVSITEVVDMNNQKKESIPPYGKKYDKNALDEDSLNFSKDALMVSWEDTVDTSDFLKNCKVQKLEGGNTVYKSENEQDTVVFDLNNIMIRKIHDITNTVYKGDNEEKINKLLERIISEYELPSNYEVTSDVSTVGYRFGSVPLYGGTIDIFFYCDHVSIICNK